MSYPGKMLDDGLCDSPTIEIPARQLLGTVCVLGGADCPLFETREQALDILKRVKADPAVAIRLTSDADRVPHYTMLDAEDYANRDREGLLSRQRDLDVLQRLGLIPSDTRRSRYLYELLLERIETPDGICASKAPAISRASVINPDARCTAKLSRALFKNRIPATRTSKAIMLNVIILRVSGDFDNGNSRRRSRRPRISLSTLASGATKSSPNTTSPSRPWAMSCTSLPSVCVVSRRYSSLYL